jgi:DDE family transposase
MPGRWESPATVAVDATGLAQSAMSSFFVRRMHHHAQQPMPSRHWLKWLTVVDVDRQLILAQSARQGPWNDWANLPSLVAEAHQHTPVGCVLADAEFDSERNHTFCRQQLKADSIIPAKRFTSRRATGIRGQMRENFPRERNAKRSLIETVFSVAKRKLSCRAPGRTVATQTRQALFLGVTYNLYRLWPPAELQGYQQSPTHLINNLGCEFCESGVAQGVSADCDLLPTISTTENQEIT